MSYTSKTLRKMPPVTRRVAKRLNEIETGIRALKRLMPAIAEHERYALAMERNLRRSYEGEIPPNGELFDPEAELVAKSLRGEL